MARILAYTTPARGHLFPLTPILDELSRRGHEISLRTLASQVSLMKGRGFDTRPISGQIEAIAIDDWRARNPQAALGRAVRTFLDRAEYDAPDLRQAIDEERPDALLVDINSWGGLAAAEAWGGPWAAFCPFPMFLRSKDVPPFGPGLAPARGPLGRLRDRLLRPDRARNDRAQDAADVQRCSLAYGAVTARQNRRPVPPPATRHLHDCGAVRVSAPRLARKHRHGGPMRVGSSGGAAAMA